MTKRMCAALSVIVLSVICLCIFRSATATQIWNSYKVLYVENSVDEADVLSFLEQAGCTDVISLSRQREPLQPYYLSALMDSSVYLQERLRYFTDRDDRYRLFYIPEAYERQAANALRHLNATTHAGAGLDGRRHFPYAVLLLDVLVCAVLATAAKDRLVFLFPSFFALLFVIVMPFHTVAAGVCLVLFALYLVNRVWGREGDIRIITKDFSVTVLVLASLCLFWGQSIRCGILSFVLYAALIAAFVVLRERQALLDKRCSFTYTLIFSARQVPLVHRKNVYYMLYLTIPLFAIVLLFVFQARFSVSSPVTNISIPMPGMEGDVQHLLPNLSDYYAWAWNVLTFPYRSLNLPAAGQTVQEGERLILPRYSQTEHGIAETEETVMVYDKKFFSKLEKDIEALEYPAIEKLMKKQGANTLVRYAVTQGTARPPHEALTLCLLLASLCVPAFLYAAYYNRGRRNV